MDVYFTADLHLGHKLMPIERGFSSIKEHDDYVIDTLASVAGSKRDVLWILGDVAFGKHNLVRLNEIPAIKKIVLGNHDQYAAENYAAVANKVFGSFAWKHDVLLTHIPVSTQQKHRFKLNVHGHLHRHYIDDLFYLNVGIDYGRPFSSGEILDAAHPELLVNKEERV